MHTQILVLFRYFINRFSANAAYTRRIISSRIWPRAAVLFASCFPRSSLCAYCSRVVDTHGHFPRLESCIHTHCAALEQGLLSRYKNYSNAYTRLDQSATASPPFPRHVFQRSDRKSSGVLLTSEQPKTEALVILVALAFLSRAAQVFLASYVTVTRTPLAALCCHGLRRSNCKEQMTTSRWRGGHCDDTKIKAHERVRAFPLPTSSAQFHYTTERSRSETSTQQRAHNQYCDARLAHCPVCASSAPRPRSRKHAAGTYVDQRLGGRAAFGAQQRLQQCRLHLGVSAKRPLVYPTSC